MANISVIIGQGQALDGREAAAQATHRALAGAGREPLVLGIVLASHQYPIQSVVNGTSTLIGDTPIFGFSTSGEITTTGVSQRSVLVALLRGNDLQARADWWPGFADDSRSAAHKMAQGLQLYQNNGSLLLATDGLNGDAKQLCASLPTGNYTLAGCLAGGDIRHRRSYQIGERQSGHGGVAAAILNGKLTLGIGLAHGWKPVGSSLKITKARGPWLRTMNDQTAAEAYANLMGYTAHDWCFPPLNELVRLYPLGLETEDKSGLLVRSPLRVETDGSLRMHTSISEGSTAYILLGSSNSCQQAAEQAAREALTSLGSAHPLFALVLVDISWQMLTESQPGIEVEAIKKVLGDIPFAGGYTYGQIARDPVSGAPELFNQHIQVILFGETE